MHVHTVNVTGVGDGAQHGAHHVHMSVECSRMQGRAPGNCVVDHQESSVIQQVVHNIPVSNGGGSEEWAGREVGSGQ